MSDRELLEMAAKAAGLGEVWYLDGSDTPYVGKKYQLGQPVEYSTFSPLTDDGDALRLAVRLAMTVRQEPSAAAAGWGADCLYGAPTVDGRGPWFWKEWLSNNQDPFAATRRAIVRAAAEIGKAMP